MKPAFGARLRAKFSSRLARRAKSPGAQIVAQRAAIDNRRGETQ